MVEGYEGISVIWHEKKLLASAAFSSEKNSGWWVWCEISHFEEKVSCGGGCGRRFTRAFSSFDLKKTNALSCQEKWWWFVCIVQNVAFWRPVSCGHGWSFSGGGDRRRRWWWWWWKVTWVNASEENGDWAFCKSLHFDAQFVVTMLGHFYWRWWTAAEVVVDGCDIGGDGSI